MRKSKEKGENLNYRDDDFPIDWKLNNRWRLVNLHFRSSFIG